MLEVKTHGDSAREDFCTIVHLPTGTAAGVGPKEMKAKVSGRTLGDPTGIHVAHNIDNHAKVRLTIVPACKAAACLHP